MPRSALLVASLFATWVIWGSTYLAIKLALGTLPPFLLSGIRYVLAGLIMLAFSRLRREAWPTWRETLNAAGGGGLALALGNGAVCVAEQYSPSGLVALVMAATPLLTVMINAGLGVRAKGVEWLGVLLGIVGVALIQIESPLAGSTLGTAIMLGGALAWAVASVSLPRLRMPAALASCAVQMLGGGVISLILGAAMHEQAHRPDATAVWALTYLILAGSLLGYAAYLWLLRHTRSAVATSFFCVNPVVALVLGAAWGQEAISGVMMVGSVIVVVAVGLALSANLRQQAAAS